MFPYIFCQVATDQISPLEPLSFGGFYPIPQENICIYAHHTHKADDGMYIVWGSNTHSCRWGLNVTGNQGP